MNIINILEEDKFIKNILSIKKFNKLKELINSFDNKTINLLYKEIKKKHPKNVFHNLKFNDLGLYISRCIYSEKYIYSKFEKYQNENLLFKKFMDDGYLVIENFISDQEFSLIKNDFNNIVNSNNSYSILPNKSISNNEYGLKKIFFNYFTTNINNFYKNKKLIELLKLCSFDINGKYIENNERNYIEVLTHIESSKDPQKIWHVDTFHPTCKWWFYINDILDKDLGPLEYIEGSHKNSLLKLKYEHETINNALKNNINCSASKSGSIRYFNKENIMKLGYKEDDFKKMLFKKNTLIITNNRGIHRRGHGKVGTKRYSLSSSLRFNIFDN